MDVVGDLDVGLAAMLSEVERLDKVALLLNELIEQDDIGHVVGERDDADTHGVGVDVEIERESAGKLHDGFVQHTAGQVQQEHQIQH